METQIVQSYVRNKHRHVEPDQSQNGIVYLVGGSTIILIAIVYWYITLPIGLAAGAVYGVKTIMEQPAPVVEVIPEPVKPKRSYNKRIKVNHYQLGSVKV